MDLVINKINNEKISILKFEKLSKIEKEIIKRNLICLECKVQAFYRKKTRDGKQACFYARHAIGCGQGISNSSSIDDSIREELNKINVTYRELILSLDQNIELYNSNKKKDLEINGDNNQNNSRSYVIDPSKNKSCRITLKKLLRYAINNLLNDIDIPIIVEGKVFKDPLDLIIYFKDISYSLKRQKRIFWGEINSISTNGQFLNSGLWDGEGYEFSILLNERVAKNSKLSKVAWDKGIYVIVIGELLYNKSSRPYVRVDDINLMALESK